MSRLRERIKAYEEIRKATNLRTWEAGRRLAQAFGFPDYDAFIRHHEETGEPDISGITGPYADVLLKIAAIRYTNE